MHRFWPELVMTCGSPKLDPPLSKRTFRLPASYIGPVGKRSVNFEVALTADRAHSSGGVRIRPWRVRNRDADERLISEVGFVMIYLE